MMETTVKIIFDAEHQYEFKRNATQVADYPSPKARIWLEQEFAAAEYETPNPMGKSLLVDKILMLAEGEGQSAFATPDEWIDHFLLATASALERPTVVIDLPQRSIGF